MTPIRSLLLALGVWLCELALRGLTEWAPPSVEVAVKQCDADRSTYSFRIQLGGQSNLGDWG